MKHDLLDPNPRAAVGSYDLARPLGHSPVLSPGQGRPVPAPRRYLKLACFCLVPLLPLLGLRWAPDRWPLWFGLLLVLSGFPVYGNLRVNCQWFGAVVTSFPTQRNEVWLTIDDGPHPEATWKTLELLRRYQARATFFAVGRQVRDYPELARAILAQGHTLGNHSHSHPSALFWAASLNTALREIDGAAGALKAVTGLDPVCFRAPVGMANCFVHDAVARRQKILVGWSARGFDTVNSNVDEIVAKLFQTVRPGAILLLHERPVWGGVASVNHLVLERVLMRLRSEGYTCVIPYS